MPYHLQTVERPPVLHPASLPQAPAQTPAPLRRYGNKCYSVLLPKPKYRYWHDRPLPQHRCHTVAYRLVASLGGCGLRWLSAWTSPVEEKEPTRYAWG